jgi:hypothetical protein
VSEVGVGTNFLFDLTVFKEAQQLRACTTMEGTQE